jgi:hypothetical protein
MHDAFHSYFLQYCAFHRPVQKVFLRYWYVATHRLRWAGHVARMGERRGAFRALVGKPEGRRPLGGPKHRWENNIKMDVREVGWGT